MSAGTSYPRWVDVEGTCRCSTCGVMAESTWRLFEAPARWTKAFCSTCVSEALAELDKKVNRS